MPRQVGQVFHPDQDRIISVRECARAQVHTIHCQFIVFSKFLCTATAASRG